MPRDMQAYRRRIARIRAAKKEPHDHMADIAWQTALQIARAKAYSPPSIVGGSSLYVSQTTRFARRRDRMPSRRAVGAL